MGQARQFSRDVHTVGTLGHRARTRCSSWVARWRRTTGLATLTGRRRPLARPATAAAVAVVAVVLAAGVTTGCVRRPGTGEGAASGEIKLVKGGALTMCTHLPAPPFEFKDSGGRIVGFDIDLINLVAARLKLTTAVIDTPFEGIKSGQDLRSGKCDLAAAGMAITPERRAVLDFSVPYFDDMLGLLITAGEPYPSLAAMRGRRLGVQAATTGREYATKHEPTYGYEVVEYQDVAAMQQALASRQIQGALHDLSVWTNFAKTNRSVRVAATIRTGDQYGIALGEGTNPRLLAAVNQTLTTAQRDGTYDRLYRKWIGAAPPAKPGPTKPAAGG